MSSPDSNGILEITTPPRRWIGERVMDQATRSLGGVSFLPTAPVATSTAMVQYQKNPLGFFIDVLGVPEYTIRWALNEGYDLHKWDGTPEPLITILEGLVNWKNVGVESATTTGKTFIGACIVLWFLACHENALVVTVAPKEEQLRLHIWKEIGKLWPRFAQWFPLAKKLGLEIRMRGGMDVSWAAIGFVAGVKADEVAGSSTKAQGFHAEHMLIVYEEMPGIHRAISTAFANTCRAPHNLQLAFGNPDHQLDALHIFCQGPRTVHVIISAYDHPNVVSANPNLIPGAVSQQGIDDALHNALNAGGLENRLYKSRVRGISPAEAKDALIKLGWIKKAQERWQNEGDRRILEAVGGGKRSLGVDVANSEDGDEGAKSRWLGAVCLEVEAKPCPDANDLGFQVHIEMNENGILPEHVGVDTVGVGAGCYNELKKRDKFVRDLNGGFKPEGSIDAEDWQNLRSQMHWVLREDLRTDQIALPLDPELVIDLITPTYRTMNGKIIVESKEDLQKRLPGGRSPNKGDAVVYGNYVRPRDAVKSDIPKTRAPTLRERVFQELQSMDNPPAKKHYGTVLRQG